MKKQFANKDQCAPWNNADYKYASFAPWHNPLYKNDQFAPWNMSWTGSQEFKRYCEETGCCGPDDYYY